MHVRESRTGFTLVELLVVIGIIAVLIAMLLPALSRVRDSATTISCQSNMRQLAQATLIYAHSNRGALPFSTKDDSGANPLRQGVPWFTYMANNVPEKVRQCPGLTAKRWDNATKKMVFPTVDQWSDEFKGLHWIAVNQTVFPRNDQWQPAPGNVGTAIGRKLSQFNRSAEIMMIIDNDKQDFAGGWHPGEHLRFRHSGGESINIGFMDGHVETWDWKSCREGQDLGYAKNLFAGNTDVLPWGEGRLMK